MRHYYHIETKGQYAYWIFSEFCEAMVIFSISALLIYYLMLSISIVSEDKELQAWFKRRAWLKFFVWIWFAVSMGLQVYVVYLRFQHLD